MRQKLNAQTFLHGKKKLRENFLIYGMQINNSTRRCSSLTLNEWVTHLEVLLLLLPAWNDSTDIWNGSFAMNLTDWQASPMQCPFTPAGDCSVVSPDSCVHIPQRMKDFAQVSRGWSACMINIVGTVHNESKRTSHDNVSTSDSSADFLNFKPQVDPILLTLCTYLLEFGKKVLGFTEHKTSTYLSKLACSWIIETRIHDMSHTSAYMHVQICIKNVYFMPIITCYILCEAMCARSLLTSSTWKSQGPCWVPAFATCR